MLLQVVRSVIVQVASHVFRGEISWARIVTLFAVAAGLASDCVKQGKFLVFPVLWEVLCGSVGGRNCVYV